MAYYWTCPYCGANLDHGEKCDCQEQEDVNTRHHRHLKQFIKNMEDKSNGKHDLEREDYSIATVY